MKLAAIHSSRVSALVELVDLVPDGKIFLPDLINSIATQCEFRKFPDSPEKLIDQSNGALFEMGKWEDQPIHKLTLFRDGIVIETSSTTEETDATLQALLQWAKESLGLHFEPQMIQRKGILSSVVVYLDVPLDNLNPILGKIGKLLSEQTTKAVNQLMNFRTQGISISTNALNSKFTPAVFSIERRTDILDVENKYFSTAPLSTTEHLKVLETFEKALQK